MNSEHDAIQSTTVFGTNGPLVDHLNTGDSGTFDSRIGGDDTKLSSTLRSYPDSSRSATGFRGHKHGNPLQALSELLGQNLKIEGLADFKELLRVFGNDDRRQLPTIPVNDLRGEEASAYSREECTLRRSLAALYRLVDVRGWTHSIYNHISARCPDNSHHFLVNPFGLLYHEIQASCLVKIDEEGNVIQQGSTVLGVNKAAWTLHSALYASRPDVNCIVHIHLPDVIAVSCIRAGLLPVSPEANELLSSIGVQYHDYHGILVDDAEKGSIQKDLGPKAKVLFLRNHGVAVAASSVAEAWYVLKRVVAACQTQMRMLQLTGGASMLADLKATAAYLMDGTSSSAPRPFSDLDGDDEMNDAHGHSLLNGKARSGSGEISWAPAELEFEAEMRVLDSAGFRTGHVYRQPNLLRRAHAASTWAGDTLGDQMTGADLFTTDFSATEFSATDDVAAAEAAGVQQVAKIVDSVKANRLKSVQRNQWLSDKRDPTAPGLVSSSMVASPGSNQSANLTPVVRPVHSFHNPPPDSPVTTPLKRPPLGYSPSSLPRAPSSLQDGRSSPMLNGESLIVTRSPPDQLRPAIKSATLPASVKNRALSNFQFTLPWEVDVCSWSSV
ncbi:class II Aldolase and Adducin domain protein [Opisthorchis viverrini]|uniref:Class II Aldolase and Adducin domain protein n=1 Tax=Opisthorchis viverrini TaxID=6198 RepID=A0A1S8X6I2_OPIVI|nr:class II Aldolase and Adducin domain protein [Opisthorchis viverrini]